MRQKIVAGNWKMNKTLKEGEKLTSEIVHIVNDEAINEVKVIIASPYIHLATLAGLVANSPKVALAAQNVSQQVAGAYTGEVSCDMLKSVGVKYVILGHSERREYHNEDNALLKEKVDTVLAAHLVPIFCCGESLDIRESGDHFHYVCNQLSESLFHLDGDTFEKIVIAYEPIWAIGTGVTASSHQAQEMHAAIRTHIAKKYGEKIAKGIPILYGGSCKPGNAQELFACQDVDGGLIGGASLQSRDFVDIVKSF